MKSGAGTLTKGWRERVRAARARARIMCCMCTRLLPTKLALLGMLAMLARFLYDCPPASSQQRGHAAAR